MGTVLIYAGEVAPPGFLLCDGRAYAKREFLPLFAVIGTRYGGDVSTFRVPDARGRVPVMMGAGTGLTPRQLGDQFGQEQVKLAVSEMPRHAHGGATGVQGGYKKGGVGKVFENYHLVQDTGSAVNDVDGGFHTHSISEEGGNGAHENMPPSLVFNAVIKH